MESMFLSSADVFPLRGKLTISSVEWKIGEPLVRVNLISGGCRAFRALQVGCPDEPTHREHRKNGAPE